MSLSATDNPDRNLSYQCYFLLRTQFWQGESLGKEPLAGFGDIEELGIAIDNDKRLFRYNAPAQTPLADWGSHLLAGWRQLEERYALAFRSPEEARRYLDGALLGVGLLILDATLERHRVKLPLLDPDGQPTGKDCGFRHLPEGDTWLLSLLRDRAGALPEPARLYAFRPEFAEHGHKLGHWRLSLAGEYPALVPMQEAPGNEPVFLVLGLAHGDALTAGGEPQPWAWALSDFVSGSRDQPRGRTALLNALMARMLIREAVFNWADFAALGLRRKLQVANLGYRARTDQELEETPNGVLEDELRAMDRLAVESQHLSGYLGQCLQSLEINRDNLRWRLEKLSSEPDWEVDWRGQEPQPPLLERVTVDIENLQSHVSYLESARTYLESSRRRWQSYLSERSHEATERLGHAGHLIIFLLALAEMSHTLGKLEFELAGSWIEQGYQGFLHLLHGVLHNPTSYVLILSLFLLRILWDWVKRGWKSLKYRFASKKRNKP